MRSLFVTLILLFSSLSFAQNSINLTSWNIEWLSIDGGKVSRTPQDFEKLTHYVDKTQADILAFQEVESVAAMQKAVGMTSLSIFPIVQTPPTDTFSLTTPTNTQALPCAMA